MKLRTALLAATVLGAPLAAKAQPVSGLYIGAGAGVNILQNPSLQSITVPGSSLPGGTTALGGNINTKAGFVGLGSIGYGLGNGLRFELEGSYRQNRFNKVGGLAGGGDEEKPAVMVNALYDFDLGFPVFPYVGVGAGYAWAIYRNVHAYTPGNAETLNINSTEGSFAYQAILGVAFPVAPVPGLSLTAEYRFMGLAGDRKYDGSISAGGVTVPATLKVNQDFNHSFLLGVRYAFNAAPPPPPAPAPVAAPAPAPARTYLVFFDWDRADLTPRARQIIREAADASTHVQYTRIQVNGYTDTSGTAKYNMGLSIRRAQNVAAELVRNGVPRTAIDIKGFGETHPLVPTGPGVREPQNRRVEIIIQ